VAGGAGDHQLVHERRPERRVGALVDEAVAIGSGDITTLVAERVVREAITEVACARRQ
jgi:hypothetical protein